MLEISGVDAGYGNTRVLRGIDLRVEPGEVVSLIGANGAGKTTLLRVVSGVLVPWRGKVRFNGIDITGAPPDKVVKLGVAHCPENRHVWPQMTVLEHLQLGARGRKDVQGIRQDMEQVFGYFPVLRERLRSLAGNLSGGQQQMLAIARALMSRPRLLMLDEPSLGLAPLVITEVARALRSIHAGGTSILLVEQNANLALRLADRAYVLETGSITLSGRAGELAEDPRIQKAYLGATSRVPRA